MTDAWNPFAETRGLATAICAGRLVRPGDRVILRPKRGGEVFDLALAGRTAAIASIELDFENRIHVAVTIDDDPGRDLGAAMHVGHRFFFGPDELEPLAEERDR